MKKMKLNQEYKPVKQPFEIPQFPKIVGLRTKKEEPKKESFVSPIFGHNVKDDVIVPVSGKLEGDQDKRLDAFRTKPKLTEADRKKKYGSVYHEFTNIISNDARKTYMGAEVYTPKKEDQKVEETQVTKHIRAVGIEEKVYQKEPEIAFDYKERPRVAEVSPFEEIEPKIETYESNVVEEEVFPETVFEKEILEPTPQTFEPRVEKEKEIEKPRVIQPRKSSMYRLPNVKTFQKKERDLDEKPQWLLDQIESINMTLTQFGVEGKVVGSKKGPTVTRYEVALEPGVNVKRVLNLQDNLMMNLAATSLRIEAPIPGKPYVGLEVPNLKTEIVAFGNVVDQPDFLEDNDHPLKVALGVDIDGENIYVDIAKMPHGLIAGSTNSGKSVCVNTILVSLLLKNKPEDLRLILIDPKMVELTTYNDLPHLVTPVITDPKMAASALSWAVEEMEKRYQSFANTRSRDIKSYNEQVERGVISEEKMPYLVIVIDELADLMMVAAHDVEDAIQRITQKARAAGIHLLVATQRPTTDVVKGTIKSNIPTRIAFRVASFVDSTTILDGAGAESLLGKGDMLLKEGDKAHRLQGAFISSEEIDATTDFIRSHSEPNYIFKHEKLKQQVQMKEKASDDLFEPVARFVVENGNASINSIQKQFEIGFNRAQKIVEMLEENQIVSRSQGTKAREVLVTDYELDTILGIEEE